MADDQPPLSGPGSQRYVLQTKQVISAAATSPETGWTVRARAAGQERASRGIGVAPALRPRQASIRADQTRWKSISKTARLHNELMCKKFHPTAATLSLPHARVPLCWRFYFEDWSGGIRARGRKCRGCPR